MGVLSGFRAVVSAAAVFSDDALEDDALTWEPAHEDTPERAFERRWVLTLLGRVMERLRGRYEDSGQGVVFEAFKDFLTGTAQRSQAQIGESLGLRSTASKVAVHRLGQRYGQLLRDEVSQTLEDPTEIEAELRDLMAVLSG